MPAKKHTTKKAAAPKRTIARRKKSSAVTDEMIATRAYFLHLERGGEPFDNWLQAERDLVAA